mgnify:CR=1 FL=1
MTIISFYKKNNLFLGYEVKGHTGKADRGEDLLCCQISTVAQLGVVGVNEVEKANAFVEISDGYLKLSLNEKQANKREVQSILKTCYESFRSIVVDEKKYAKLEVKNV